MRRRSRECAVQILYQLDIQNKLLGIDGDGGAELVGSSIAGYWLNLDGDVPVDREFAERLVRGVCSRLATVDATIVAAAVNWRMDRMEKVDRNVMRVAAYEILFCPDVPAKVSIDEAIEVAKRFSSSDSASFVNGVLDALSRRAETAAAPGNAGGAV